MFTRNDRYRDTLAAGVAMLAIAALLVPVILWLTRGLDAADHDLGTIQSHRAHGDIVFYGIYLYAGAAVLGTAAAALAGLGVWLIVGGAVRTRRRLKR